MGDWHGDRRRSLGAALKLGLLRGRRRVVVEVYTRAGCGLCERAERLVAREATRAEIRYVDVDADPELQRRYNVRVPVVSVNGHEIAEAHLPAGMVRRAVRRARGRRPATEVGG